MSGGWQQEREREYVCVSGATVGIGGRAFPLASGSPAGNHFYILVGCQENT